MTCTIQLLLSAQAERDAARADLDAALARIRELEEALTPFAALAAEIERVAGPNGGPNRWAKSCEWSDLRRAASVLNQGAPA